MITPITATFPALNFPKEVDYPTQEDWAAFSAAAELNYGILSGEWSYKSEEFKTQTNNLALEIQQIGKNAINTITFDNIAQLKLNSNINRVDVLGYYAKGDVGGGTFYWNATSTETDNGGTIIQATGITTGRWKRVFGGVVNVKWFGAKGDGVTDDTLAINSAISFTSSIKSNLLFPAGTYIVSGLNAVANMQLIGEGSTSTRIKLKNNSNTHLVNSLTNTIDDIRIQGIIFDGNRANNTVGNGLNLYGSKHILIDVRVVEIAENGIVSDWQGPSFKQAGFEGFYSNITIDTCGKSGWVYNGASDSHFEAIYIIDTSLSTTNTYYGLFLAAPSGNGRFFNIHPWNRSDKSIVAKTGVYVESSGNNFSGCHFEGSTIPLGIAGSGNTFDSCSYYAPRGGYCVDLAGSSNIVNGSMGLTAFSGNLSYKGILLSGGNNQVNLVDTGCLNGSIEFNGPSSGLNKVIITGNRSGVRYVGTPSATDEVDIILGGTANTRFSQKFKTDWTSYAPVLSSGSGTFVNATASGKYKKIGNLVFVTMTITITDKGTAAGDIGALLPINCSTANIFSANGRESGLTGKNITGIVGTTKVQLWFYDNTTAISNGNVIIISFFYESV